MADRANAHDAVPRLQMAPGIPGNGGNAVAELDAVAIQMLRYLERAAVDFGIIGAMDGAFDRSCDDLLGSMNGRRMFENSVTKQRPVLHQPTHTEVPPHCTIACRVFHGIAMNFSAGNARRKW